MNIGAHYLKLNATRETIRWLSELLGPNAFQMESKNGFDYLFVKNIDDEPDNAKKYELARKEIENLNLVIKAYSGNPFHEKSINFDTIVIPRANGMDIMIEVLPLNIAGNVSAGPATVHSTVQAGTGPRRNLGEDYFMILKSNPDVSEIANLLGKIDNLQFEYWKAKELMVGKRASLETKGYLSTTENEEFNKWAHNPDASGANARHAVGDAWQARVRNISDKEARDLVLKSFQAWLVERFGRNIL